MTAQLPLFRPLADFVKTTGGCRFYLGTHRPDWLAKVAIPLFVSRRTLGEYRTLPRARGRWALDSAGFTEISEHGAWTVTPEAYAAEVRRYAREVGGLEWAAIQDWMCEPQVIGGLVKPRNPTAKRAPTIDTATWLRWARTAGPVLAGAVRAAEELGDEAHVLFHGTGLSVEEHQRRTIVSYLRLRELAPEIPWAPVIQGFALADYLRHADAYEAAGVPLRHLPIVGVGSVCRRQHSAEVEGIFRALSGRGLALHGFGVKQKGLARSARYLASADSLAWSTNGRRNAPPAGCPHSTRPRRPKNCANCMPFALEWRARLLAATPGVA